MWACIWLLITSPVWDLNPSAFHQTGIGDNTYKLVIVNVGFFITQEQNTGWVKKNGSLLLEFFSGINVTWYDTSSIIFQKEFYQLQHNFYIFEIRHWIANLQ